MAKRTEIDVREIVRVIFSGMAAFVAVDLLLLPQLIERGMGFPTYFYVALVATAVLASGICKILRPRVEPKDKVEVLHPAQ